MTEMKNGCVKPARGPIPHAVQSRDSGTVEKGGVMLEATTARVGYEAPDFEANALVGETGFKTVKLSDYKGRWIVLCFYPGDFTFV
jgi:hypothetical protein